jgi:hypothetical protein
LIPIIEEKLKMRTREQIMNAIAEGLGKHFHEDTIGVEPGFANNIRVKVVSKKFDDMSDGDAAEYLWKLIEDCGLSDDEKILISLILPVGLRDL